MNKPIHQLFNKLLTGVSLSAVFLTGLPSANASSEWENISSTTDITTSSVQRSRRSPDARFYVSATNLSQEAITGELTLVIEGLQPNTLTLPDFEFQDNRYTLDITSQISEGWLSGQTLANIEVLVEGGGRTSFSYASIQLLNLDDNETDPVIPTTEYGIIDIKGIKFRLDEAQVTEVIDSAGFYLNVEGSIYLQTPAGEMAFDTNGGQIKIYSDDAEFTQFNDIAGSAALPFPTFGVLEGLKTDTDQIFEFGMTQGQHLNIEGVKLEDNTEYFYFTLNAGVTIGRNDFGIEMGAGTEANFIIDPNGPTIYGTGAISGLPLPVSKGTFGISNKELFEFSPVNTWQNEGYLIDFNAHVVSQSKGSIPELPFSAADGEIYVNLPPYTLNDNSSSYKEDIIVGGNADISFTIGSFLNYELKLGDASFFASYEDEKLKGFASATVEQNPFKVFFESLDIPFEFPVGENTMKAAVTFGDDPEVNKLLVEYSGGFGGGTIEEVTGYPLSDLHAETLLVEIAHERFALRGLLSSMGIHSGLIYNEATLDAFFTKAPNDWAVTLTGKMDTFGTTFIGSEIRLRPDGNSIRGSWSHPIFSPLASLEATAYLDSNALITKIEASGNIQFLTHSLEAEQIVIEGETITVTNGKLKHLGGEITLSGTANNSGTFSLTGTHDFVFGPYRFNSAKVTLDNNGLKIQGPFDFLNGSANANITFDENDNYIITAAGELNLGGFNAECNNIKITQTKTDLGICKVYIPHIGYVSVSGTFSASGDYSLRGTAHINIGSYSLSNASITLSNNGVSVAGNINVAGTHTRLTGYISSGGSYKLTGTSNIRVGGLSMSSALTLNNQGLKGTGDLVISGSAVATRFDVNGSGTIHNLSGYASFTVAGHAVSNGSIFLQAGKIHGQGQLSLAGNNLNVSFEVATNGSIQSLRGTANLSIGGITLLNASVSKSGNSFYVAGTAKAGGLTATLSGYIHSNRTIDLHGSASLSAGGYAISNATLKLNNSGLSGTGSINFAGQAINIGFDVSSSGAIRGSGSVYINQCKSVNVLTANFRACVIGDVFLNVGSSVSASISATITATGLPNFSQNLTLNPNGSVDITFPAPVVPYVSTCQTLIIPGTIFNDPVYEYIPCVGLTNTMNIDLLP